MVHVGDQVKRGLRKTSKPNMVWASKARFESEPGAVFANQANQANQPWSLRAKRVSRVSEPSAVYFLKFALLGTFEQSALRERQTKQNKPANKQVKQIKLAKLAIPGQISWTSETQPNDAEGVVWLSFWCLTARASQVNQAKQIKTSK